MKKLRCAIYTRKSSEEGLEQDFNSLDAQREACAAYIQSQASEGWSLVGKSYDDGGLSGGTMERPALQQLLKDIRDGRIDVVVVYKVDRLTRSLLDFARLVETMDSAEVSFVSVTHLDPGNLAGFQAPAGQLRALVREKRAGSIRSLIERVTVRADRLTIALAAGAVGKAIRQTRAPSCEALELDVGVRLTRTGRAVKLIHPGGRASAVQVDNQVVGLLNQAKEWWQKMIDDDITAAELARREDVNDSYVTRIVRLNFLAHDIVQAILSGTQPAMLDAQRLKAGDFPVCWKEQRELYGFAAR